MRVLLAGLLVVLLPLSFALTGPWDRAGAPEDRPAVPLPRDDKGRALRLVLLGTSLSHAQGWPETTAAALSRCIGRHVDLVRVTRPGANSAWGMTRIAEVSAARPDIVLIEFAINDADLRDGLWRASARNTHRALIARLQRARPEARVVLMTMNPAAGLRGLVRPRLGAHYRDYRDLAAETGAGLVDLYPRWRTRPRPDWGLEDGLHPEQAAAEAVIVPVLVPYLGVVAGADCASSVSTRAIPASPGRG